MESEIELRRQSKRQRQLISSDFQDTALIGKGAFGKVYMSTFLSSGNVYAVKKIVKPDPTSFYFEHIRTEFKVLKALDSPYVTQFYGSFLSDTHVHFVMEYAAGGTMRDLLRRELMLEETAVQFYAAELFLGIAYLHSQNIAHRDLKCENLLLTKQGHLKICDFGFSKTSMTANCKSRNFCGTTSMKALEIIRHEPYTRSVDWWCFGIIIFQMACGKNPLDAGNREETIHRIKEFRNESFRLEKVPWTVRSLTDHCVVDRRERFGQEQIRNHILFAPNFFHELEAGNVQPPFRGEINVYDIMSNNTNSDDKEFVYDVQDNLFKKFIYTADLEL